MSIDPSSDWALLGRNAINKNKRMNFRIAIS
jgi:hypothetical protein